MSTLLYAYEEKFLLKLNMVSLNYKNIYVFIWVTV